MIDILERHISRSMSYPGDFVTPEGLKYKVGPDGKLLPYVGNTTVFLLDEDTKRELKQLQDELYRAAPWMLAEPLKAESFHMTLHSLEDGPPGMPGLSERMTRAEVLAKPLLSEWQGQPPIPMKTTWMFNMAHTSIVLGLQPIDNDSWKRLDEMYCALEMVHPLGYAMTPHITLCYFRPGTYSQEEIAPLRDVLRKVDMDITLQMEDLVVQEFRDMNTYMTV